MILLTLSRGKGEETVRLQLPASPAEIGETFAFLDRISLDTTATAILDVSSNVPVLYRCLYDVDVEDSEQFQKLQKLAERTEALSPAKAAIFSGALDAECVWNLEGALSLCNVSQTAEYRAHLVCPVHVHICAQKRLYRVNDNKPCVVFPDCPCYALIGKGQRCVPIVNDKHSFKVCFRFHQSGLDGIAQTVLCGLVDDVERLKGLHTG